MKRIVLPVLAVAALNILACGSKSSEQPGYGRIPFGKQKPQIFNSETIVLPDNKEFSGANIKILDNGSAHVFTTGKDAQELFESLHIAPEDFAGDEHLKPEDRVYLKGQIKRGDNFFCTVRPHAKSETGISIYRCQFGLEAWWGKTAGFGNKADSGTNHFFWGPDASKAKVQTGYFSNGLFLPAANSQGRFLGYVTISGGDAGILFAAMKGVVAKTADVNGVSADVKMGEVFVCTKKHVGVNQVTYDCSIGIDYQRGATAAITSMSETYQALLAAQAQK